MGNSIKRSARLRIRSGIGILVAGVLLVGAGPAPAEIPANTWVRLQAKPCEGALCSSPYPEKRGYSGSVVGGGYLWYWGGAHKSHPGNDIDAYDIARNRWVQLTSMEDWRDFSHWDHLTAEQKEGLKNAIGGGGSPDFLSPKGRLLPAHSYARHAWWPERGEYCELKDGLWCYDPAKGDEWGAMASSAHDPSQPDGAWEEVTPSYPGAAELSGCSFATALAYDPAHRTLALFSGCDSAGYLLEDGGWVKRASGFPYRKFSEIYAVFVPPWDDWLVLHKRVLMRVDLDSGKVSRISPPPLRDAPFSVSMEWAPEIQRVIFVDGGESFNRMLAYDPAADSWQQLFLRGAAPADATPRWDVLDRDPATGRYYMLHIPRGGGKRIPGDVWTFRLSADALGNKPEPCPVDACVGDQHLHATLQAALDAAPPGGVVGVADGSYAQCATITKPVTIRPLSGRPHFHDKICRGKGALVDMAPGTVTIRGLEVSGIRGEKAIWQHHTAGTLILRDMVIHDSGMGVFASRAHRLEVRDSVLYGMDDRDELAHFIYGGELDELVVEGNYLYGGSDGHFIKAASVATEIRYNYVRNTRATDAALIDVWGCGANRVIGNVLFSRHDGPGNAIKVHNRGDGTPGPPFRTCPVQEAKAEVAYNSYWKQGGSNTSFLAESYNGPASGTPPLELRVVNNVVALPAQGGKLVYAGEDRSARFADNLYSRSPAGFYRDERLHREETRPAAPGVEPPARQYAHPAATEDRQGPAVMGAYGRSGG